MRNQALFNKLASSPKGIFDLSSQHLGIEDIELLFNWLQTHATIFNTLNLANNKLTRQEPLHLSSNYGDQNYNYLHIAPQKYLTHPLAAFFINFNSWKTIDLSQNSFSSVEIVSILGALNKNNYLTYLRLDAKA
jgi:hypothetical protein